MEYRTWTAVADLPFEAEAGWLPLTRHIERQHPELGPVVTWEENATVLILADEHPDSATAAEQALRVVEEALRVTKLTGRSPRVLQVEAAEPTAASAASAA